MQASLFQNQKIQNILTNAKAQLYGTNINHGYTLLYDNKVLTQIKYVDYQRNIKHLASAEIINFKIFTFGSKPNATNIKIQIDSDSDPFFSSVFETDSNRFGLLKIEQTLNFDFQNFPTVLIKSFNKIQQKKGQMNASLLVYSDGNCKLTIWHCSEYKNIQVISIDFGQQTEDDLQGKVALKYEQLRRKVASTEQRLLKINQIIQQKNPSLLMQLVKTTQGN